MELKNIVFTGSRNQLFERDLGSFGVEYPVQLNFQIIVSTSVINSRRYSFPTRFNLSFVYPACWYRPDFSAILRDTADSGVFVARDVYVFAFVFLLPSDITLSRRLYILPSGTCLYFKGVSSSGIYVRYSPRCSNSETWSWPIEEWRRHGWTRSGRKRGGIRRITAFEMDAGAISDGALNRPSRTSIANIMLNLSWIGQCRRHPIIRVLNASIRHHIRATLYYIVPG